MLLMKSAAIQQRQSRRRSRRRATPLALAVLGLLARARAGRRRTSELQLDDPLAGLGRLGRVDRDGADQVADVGPLAEGAVVEVGDGVRR